MAFSISSEVTETYCGESFSPVAGLTACLTLGTTVFAEETEAPLPKLQLINGSE
jgi:hypothetical protein